MEKWIKIDHENDKRGKTKPPIGEMVLLSNCGDSKGRDSWVVAGSRDKRGLYWNQFMDKYSDCSIYPTHWTPMPDPAPFTRTT